MRHSGIYVDTSVLGGYFDQEFAEWSRALVEDFRAARLRPVLSDLLAAEIGGAPMPVRELHSELLALVGIGVQMSTEAIELADRYAAHGILPAKFRNDMLHIALATVANADVVACWNFRHIVRFDKIRLFNAVN
ncbi:MAG: hypothetical protein ABI877_07725, partial [Gemmatimonadaceae bacterium]